MAESQPLAPGVQALDHTADVGIEVRAASLAELFHRAATGMMALAWEGVATHEPSALPPGAAGESRRIELEADDLSALLALWLRELLYLHEAGGLSYDRAAFEALDERRLRADVALRREPQPPARELKGVTYHGLEVACWHGEWHARVVFDV